ncbi:Gap junction alpha-4 protein [Triplophysa tibetana]|uniref:Gap junction protein n=1 Tax=Triplophysa tibetana TaxID=1572043 RepID=A0A5A9NLY8_9TELE|nr:Gap junction alpha-4 protein [Triplophysa tibetana]
MSRADWGFLEHLLEEGQEYSTGVGRVWLTVLFLFRMLVLGTAAETAWDDEQSDFVCNTKQPGCVSVCYDKAFPISHFRYFVMQVIFVSTPTIFYFGYVALRAGDKRGNEEKLEEGRRQTYHKTNDRTLQVIVEEDEDVEEKSREKKSKASEAPKLKGRLLCAYAASIAFKVLLEIIFIVGLWFLYGFVIESRYECQRFPCPHTVDCFVSRPTEKTIFTVYTQVIAVISVLLNIVELFHLLQLAITYKLEKRYQGQAEIIQFISRNPSKAVPAESFEERERVFLPIANNSFPSEWDNKEPHLTENTLPSYLNCINNVKPATHKSSSTIHLHKKHQKTDNKDKPSRPGHYV